jgi:hypothetical protein
MGYICILLIETSCDARITTSLEIKYGDYGGNPTFYLYFYLSILLTMRSDHLY